QVRGCATYARVLAGDALSYSDEVEGCYGVRPVRAGEDVYRAAHEQLDRLLPGEGSLFDRRQEWRKRHLLQGELAVPALRDLLPVLRARTVALLDLPPGEEVTLEPVEDEPWWAFNYYLGDLKSRVVLNVDVPTTGLDLVHLEQAKHTVRFVTDPTWRAYTITYSAGRDLCRAYVDGDPARFRTLLTEQVRIGDLLAAGD